MSGWSSWVETVLRRDEWILLKDKNRSSAAGEARARAQIHVLDFIGSTKIS